MAGSQWVFVWVLVCDDGGLRVMVVLFFFLGGTLSVDGFVLWFDEWGFGGLLMVGSR